MAVVGKSLVWFMVNKAIMIVRFVDERLNSDDSSPLIQHLFV